MTRQQLLEDIENTAKEIDQLKQQIQDASSEKEKRRVAREKKELQYLQFWRFDLLERSDDE